ncbi:hypothetical protein [Kitasatospora sp. NPDC057015]|uniref:hypothetical protein n=1 Tax=Kitasatospora sp. NPDC057015 TaxID=3346001 RepID=UPI003630464A
MADADHDCDEDHDGEISWEGRAECTCRWSLQTQFADGDYIEADHDCNADQWHHHSRGGPRARAAPHRFVKERRACSALATTW